MKNKGLLAKGVIISLDVDVSDDENKKKKKNNNALEEQRKCDQIKL